MGDSDSSVQWPGQPTNADGDEIGKPTLNLIKSLNLFEAPKPDASNTAAGVIESTTLQVTEDVKKLITQAGGGAATIGALTSLWAALEDNTALAVTLAGGVALVLAASAIALAQVMNGDVRGRAAVTTEQLSARAAVATAFINESSKHLPPDEASESSAESGPGVGSSRKAPDLASDLQTTIALGRPVKVKTTHGSEGTLVHARWTKSDGLRLTLDSGDDISPAEIDSFTTP